MFVLGFQQPDIIKYYNFYGLYFPRGKARGGVHNSIYYRTYDMMHEITEPSGHHIIVTRARDRTSKLYAIIAFAKDLKYHHNQL